MAVTLCFDDGYEEVHRIAFPLFAEYGITGTLGIITEAIGGSFEGYPTMSLPQIKELYDGGWETASHSATHPFLTSLTDEEIMNELVNSRGVLKNLGFGVNAFIVPYGDYDGRIHDLVARHYYSCRPSIWGENSIPVEDRHMLKSKWVMNDSFETIKSWIDDSIANNTWLIIMLHNIDKPEREYNISSENLSKMAEYLAMQEVDVLNISEILMPPKPIIPLILAFIPLLLIPLIKKYK